MSASTDYVIVGENAGSKADKATKLGVPVIDETRFENSSSKRIVFNLIVYTSPGETSGRCLITCCRGRKKPVVIDEYGSCRYLPHRGPAMMVRNITIYSSVHAVSELELWGGPYFEATTTTINFPGHWLLELFSQVGCILHAFASQSDFVSLEHKPVLREVRNLEYKAAIKPPCRLIAVVKAEAHTKRRWDFAATAYVDGELVARGRFLGVLVSKKILERMYAKKSNGGSVR